MRRRFVLTAILAALQVAPALAHADKLAGGEWALAGKSGEDQPYLRFEGGRVGGSGGCNRFGASYSQSGDSLSFSPIAATRMACKGSAGETERAFFDMLGRVKGMKLSDDTLTLLDAEGRVLGTLTRRMTE